MKKMVGVMEERSIDRIIHLAGLVSSLAQRSPHLATMVNCGGIANLHRGRQADRDEEGRLLKLGASLWAIG